MDDDPFVHRGLPPWGKDTTPDPRLRPFSPTADSISNALGCLAAAALVQILLSAAILVLLLVRP